MQKYLLSYYQATTFFDPALYIVNHDVGLFFVSETIF